MDKKIIQSALLLAVMAGTPVVPSTFAAPGHDHGSESKGGGAAKDDHDHDHDHDEKGGEKKEHADEVKLTEVAIKQNNVRVAVVEAKNLRASFVAPARVAYNTEAMAHVGSVVSGRVIEVKAKVGDKVKKDDELLVVESPDLGKAQSDFLQRRTEVEVANAAVGPAKDAYTRAKKLFDESQGIAYTEVQKREAEYRAATGNAASSKAALQAAENGLRLYGLSNEAVKTLAENAEINPKFQIRAALDGQIISREVTLGELVSPDKEKLFVIADTSKSWVIAEVPEGRLADVGVGSHAEVQIASLPGEPIKGEVSLVSPEIDASTRTARLRIVVDNASGKLKPGMFARAMIQSGNGDAGTASLAVPEDAVQTVEGRPSVFVPVDGEANTFARREVTVGRPVSGYVPINSGLLAGEKVVVTGTFILKAELGKSEAGHEH